jgi:hypothetical protein
MAEADRVDLPLSEDTLLGGRVRLRQPAAGSASASSGSSATRR